MYYLGEDDAISSPIHRTEEKFTEEMVDKENSKPTTSVGLGRLKALANTRNQWEDDNTASGAKVLKIFKTCSIVLIFLIQFN